MNIDLSRQLHGDRLTLRRFELDDGVLVHAILSDWNVAQMLQRADRSPTLDTIRKWLVQHEPEWRSGRAYRFGVISDGRIICCADVGDINNSSRRARLLVRASILGRGVGSEAARLVQDFAVGHLGLTRLRAGHAIENVASGRILLKLGFRPTGDLALHYPARNEDVPYRRYRFEVER